MQYKALVFLALLAMAYAMPDRPRYYNAPEQSQEEEEDHSYEFRWQVQEDSDELDFGHSEQKSDGRVEGYYYVLLPDSRIQRVKYYVDGDSGFVADVDFEGEAKFDSAQESSREYQRYQQASRESNRY